jgi:hypothetical protein
MPTLIPDSLKYDLQCQLQACQSRSRRNGKVARLPAALREQINQMLDDGLPYKQIIQRLGPAGAHLNEDNLSNWRLGGYQDYLKTIALNDRAHLQIESAAQVVADKPSLDQRDLEAACRRIAVLHYMNALLRHGNHLAQEALARNPAKIITLMNALTRL